MVFRHAQMPGLPNVGEWVVASKLFYADMILCRIIRDDHVGNGLLIVKDRPEACF